MADNLACYEVRFSRPSVVLSQQSIHQINQSIAWSASNAGKQSINQSIAKPDQLTLTWIVLKVFFPILNVFDIIVLQFFRVFELLLIDRNMDKVRKSFCLGTAWQILFLSSIYFFSLSMSVMMRSRESNSTRRWNSSWLRAIFVPGLKDCTPSTRYFFSLSSKKKINGCR